MPLRRRRTKILCTYGPSTASEEKLTALLAAGLDAVRLNFSHGTQKVHEEAFNLVRKVAENEGRQIPVVQDIQGPKIRIGKLAGGGVDLRKGQEITFIAGEEPEHEGELPITYEHLAEDVKAGDPILMDDGYLGARVTEVVDHRTVRAVVEYGGRLKSNKGVNFPGVRLSAKFPTEKDKHDLRFGQELGVDYVAASFVRSAADIARVRAELDDALGTKVIAKVELREALENMEEIVLASDAVMVARGDLGVELPLQDLPAIQKALVYLCDRHGTPVVTATQMLESMITNPRPTRAEVTDVFNAIMDGTGAVMLSGETAVGEYPVETVETMAKICLKAEEKFLGRLLEERRNAITRQSPSDAIAHAASRAAEDLHAAAIVALTQSGTTARYVSKYKPRTPIVAATPDARVARQLNLLWGAEPVLIDSAEDEEGLLENVRRTLLESGTLRKEDLVALTFGRLGVPGSTNTLRIEKLGRLAAG